MGTSTGAGGRFRIGLAVNTTPESLPVYASDTMRDVGMIEEDTPPPFEKKTSEVVTLNDGTFTFGAGNNTQVYEATIVRNSGNTPHDDLFADALATTGQYRNYEVVFSDPLLKPWRFKGFVSKYAMEPRTAENATKFKLTVQVYQNIVLGP